MKIYFCSVKDGCGYFVVALDRHQARDLFLKRTGTKHRIKVKCLKRKIKETEPAVLKFDSEILDDYGLRYFDKLELL